MRNRRRTNPSQGPKESPNDIIYQMMFGFQTTQTLYVAAKLGVPDLLQNEPKDSNELARLMRVDPRALFRVLRALSALGVLTYDSSKKFRLTPVGRVLCTDDPRSLRYFVIMLGEEHYRTAADLLHTVRTGETSFNRLYGKSHYQYLSEHPEARRVFDAAMAEGLRQSSSPIQVYDFSNRRLLVDVGGGRGDMIVSALKKNPALKGILFELPLGIRDARSYIDSQRVADRCQIIFGSAFESMPAGADVYVMSRLLHDFSDERAAIILVNCRRAIAKEGILLIQESVIRESDTSPRRKLLDLTMLYMEGGAERTEQEWRNLLLSSGFDLVNIRRARGTFDLIEARPI